MVPMFRLPHLSRLRRFGPVGLLPFLVLLALIGVVGPARGMETSALSLVSGQDPGAVRPYAQFYDDGGGDQTLSNLLTDPSRFQPARSHQRHPEAARHWIRLPLVNDGEQAGTWLLALGLPDAKALRVYRVGRDGVDTLLDLPGDAPFSARPVSERLLAVPFTLAPGERAELYLDYRTHSDTPLTLAVQTPNRFRHDLALDNLVNGAVLGLLLALTLFALLHYLATERAAFLAYGGMALLMMLFLLQFEGYNFALLWPDQGRWNTFAPLLFAMGIQLTQALFTITLFELPRRYPRLFRLYLGYVVLLLGAFLVFLAFDTNWPLLTAALAYVPLVVYAGLFFLRQGLSTAGFFLAGAIGNALFTNVLFGLSITGVDFTVSPFVFPKIGYVWEALCFALALTRQMQALQRRIEDGLRRHLAETEQLARAEAEKHRVLLAAQQKQLQLAATGHDLSQPLAAIRLGLTALKSTSNEAAVHHIDQAVDYTESLLRALVDDAKADFREAPQQVDLAELLAETHRRHHEAAKRKGLKLRYRAGTQQVEASALVLSRILDNLVGNAVRYTRQGGILIGVRHRRDGLEIQVRDSGPGFDQTQRQHLLEPFRQSGKLAEEQQGHGLGLHIVQTLCRQCGYQLTIQSRPGWGSTFGVLIPRT